MIDFTSWTFAAGVFAGASVGVVLAGLLARREIDEIRREHLRQLIELGVAHDPGPNDDYDVRELGTGANP